jgi:hypothetical protein
LPTSSNMQISPILILLSRTKAIHPPQKVCTALPFESGREFTVQHRPCKLQRMTSVLQFGRYAAENWWGIFCTMATEIVKHQSWQKIAKQEKLLNAVVLFCQMIVISFRFLGSSYLFGFC